MTGLQRREATHSLPVAVADRIVKSSRQAVAMMDVIPAQAGIPNALVRDPRSVSLSGFPPARE
jgi:hypothetical protein